MTPSLAELGAMKAALAAGAVPVRYFAEQDALNSGRRCCGGLLPA